MFFGESILERDRGLPPNTKQYKGLKSFVNSLFGKYVDNKNILDLGGIEPPEPLVATRDPRQARPRTNTVYHNNNFQ
ncbi:TPA: hypothetical protein DEW47_01805 [Patescibacteria group bacterium]|nr:hypothetical protein [Patescibacteria group bacterium]HCI04702.1 hypothetical protein [Patescibacteria group bacterium]